MSIPIRVTSRLATCFGPFLTGNNLQSAVTMLEPPIPRKRSPLLRQLRVNLVKHRTSSAYPLVPQKQNLAGCS